MCTFLAELARRRQEKYLYLNLMFADKKSYANPNFSESSNNNNTNNYNFLILAIAILCGEQEDLRLLIITSETLWKHKQLTELRETDNTRRHTIKATEYRRQGTQQADSCDMHCTHG